MNEINPNELLLVAREAAHAAGQLAKQKFYQPIAVANKGYRDYVTEVDIAAQRLITDHVAAAFPDHGFLTEEDDPTLSRKGPVTWIIDPIDGTTNYSRQVPLFCISIAAVLNRPGAVVEDVLAAVIFDPMRGEMFTATAGGAAQLNGRPLHVTGNDNLEPATIGVDWNRAGPVRQETLASVNRLVHDVDGVACYHSAALALAWVAAGRIDGYFNLWFMPWDVAAACLLIRQTGGTITSTAGKPIYLDGNPLSCLASNGLLHRQLLAYLPDQNRA